MTVNEALPLAVIASSLLPGLIIFVLPESQVGLRSALNLLGALTKIILVGVLLAGVHAGETYAFRYAVLPGIDIAFKADALALLFVTLSATLWLLTTLYAIGYLEGAPNRSRFFGFFSLCVTATMGIAMAGNLFTFFVFYELLTLSTYPLVVHRGTPAGDLAAATSILPTPSPVAPCCWSACRGCMACSGRSNLSMAGVASTLGPEYRGQLQIIFLLLIAGVGVKAALVPLHGWLPQAMVAPAPVSALLHAVAVVKAGRLRHRAHRLRGLWRRVRPIARPADPAGGGRRHHHSLGFAAGAFPGRSQEAPGLFHGQPGVLHRPRRGAVRARREPLADSHTLSHQGIMKITLFFCAGNYAETLGIHKVSEMNGAGRRMPATTVAFSIGALGMIGAPFTAGAVSKAWLSDGAERAGMAWAVWVLGASSLLNAAYFLPIL
jgi:multicomponent Na+:H+ antiporter subunit D